MTYKIQSANWHITGRCNYNCKFCYVKTLNSELKDLNAAYEILHKLKSNNSSNLDIKKINFVGGEPLLHPYIHNMLKMSHDMGFVTSIVTNGSLIDEHNIKVLAEYTDWIGISVDSVSDETESILGRGKGKHVNHSLEVANLAHEYGIKLKVNTTVNSMTVDEDMHELINSMAPHRWKIFQMLHIKGQNDSCIKDLAISDEQFETFKARHNDIILRNNVVPTFESAEDMEDSYLILDPSGDVLSNNKGEYESRGLDYFITDPEKVIDIQKYVNRGAVYDM